MACAVDGEANDRGCSGCAGQQDSPDGWALMTTGRATGSRPSHRTDRSSDRRRGRKGHAGANARSRLKPPDQENPLGPCTSSASLRSGPEPRVWHGGQRHWKGRTYRSDTWPHQPATAKASKIPCQRRAVHTGPLTGPSQCVVVCAWYRIGRRIDTGQAIVG